MRKRNVEFTNSIGELTEEIANQDLEMVNGGEIKITPYLQTTNPLNPNYSKMSACVELPCVTKNSDCLIKPSKPIVPTNPYR